MSANAALITMEAYVEQGKTIENQFFIYGPKCKHIVYFWLFEGPWGGGGASMTRLGISCASAILSPIYMYM